MQVNLSISLNINSNYKITLNKISDMKYKFISYLIDNNRVNLDYEFNFKDIIKISIVMTESNRYQIHIKYIDCNNQIKSYGDYSYEFKNLTETNNFINMLTNIKFNKNIFDDINKNNFEINVNPEHIDILELNELVLLTNSFVTQDNIWVSELFEDSTDGLIYYYDMKIINFEDKKMIILFKLEEGYYTELQLYFVDNLILLDDNYNNWFPERYNLNILLINENNEYKLSLQRLNLENYKKLYSWVENKIK